jgi:hypothetical protein
MRFGLTARKLILMAGFAVILAGILCLCLSAVVAARGSWWQGTLDAFGVGLSVGGLIDVMVISGLTIAVTEEDKLRQEYSGRARALARAIMQEAQQGVTNTAKPEELYSEAMELLDQSEGLLDRHVRRVLRDAMQILQTVYWSKELPARPPPP